jgi:hypothetical protein
LFRENRMDPAAIEAYEEEQGKQVPSCWEYFSSGISGRSSRHECERCLIKEAGARRCFTIAQALPQGAGVCHSECDECSYFRRYGQLLGGGPA